MDKDQFRIIGEKLYLFLNKIHLFLELKTNNFLFMNALKYLSFLLFSLFIFGCGEKGNSDSASEETNQAADYEQMREIDLKENGLEASIYVPDERKGKLMVESTAWGSTIIQVGERFQIEVVPFGLAVEEKKIELDGDLVYEVEYLEETENLIKYSRTIRDSDQDAEYHFFMNKEINGELIEIKSSKDQSFSAKDVDLMIESAQSLQ